MDDAFCGGGDLNEGLSSTAIPISAAAVNMIKAAIFMGDPRYVYGLVPYQVGTCRASGVRPLSTFNRPRLLTNAFPLRTHSSHPAPQASCAQAQRRSSPTATPRTRTAATATTRTRTRATGRSTARPRSRSSTRSSLRPARRPRPRGRPRRARRRRRPRSPPAARAWRRSTASVVALAGRARRRARRARRARSGMRITASASKRCLGWKIKDIWLGIVLTKRM